MKLHQAVYSLLMIPLVSVAQSTDSYVCTMGDLTRRVAVERQGTAPVPCEVAYYKDSEAPGQRQALWNAQNDASYCGARAAEFVTRLEGFGWQCMAAAAQPAAANENAAAQQ